MLDCEKTGGFPSYTPGGTSRRFIGPGLTWVKTSRLTRAVLAYLAWLTGVAAAPTVFPFGVTISKPGAVAPGCVIATPLNNVTYTIDVKGATVRQWTTPAVGTVIDLSDLSTNRYAVWASRPERCLHRTVCRKKSAR